MELGFLVSVDEWLTGDFTPSMVYSFFWFWRSIEGKALL